MSRLESILEPIFKFKILNLLSLKLLLTTKTDLSRVDQVRRSRSVRLKPNQIERLMITGQLLFEGQSDFFLIDHHHMLYLCLKFDARSSYFVYSSRLRVDCEPMRAD